MTEVLLLAKKNSPAIWQVSFQNLEKAAYYYLKRYSSSSENLKRILLKRVFRAQKFQQVDWDVTNNWIEEIIEKLKTIGIIDDREFADRKAVIFNNQGNSKLMIRKKLENKGVEKKLIDESIKNLEKKIVDPDLTAAIRFVERRKMGPYRHPNNRSEYRDKDLRSMARAGFAYSVAKQLLEAESIKDLYFMESQIDIHNNN